MTINVYEQLSSKPANSHYLKRYAKFIEACSNTTTGYIERHHICPKALFPEFADLRSHKWNSAKLSARQHFIAHWMLAKAYGGSMWYALMMMQVSSAKHHDRDFKMTSSLYEVARRNGAEHHSKVIGGANHFMYGRKHSSETIEKQREVKRGAKNPNYGKVISPEQKLKISKANKGKKRTKEFCELISAMKLAEPVKRCPHCGAESKSQGNMTRWHFDNCKQKGA